MKIAIIGAGNLGLAIAKGILHSNGATSMYLTKRNTAEISIFENLTDFLHFTKKNYNSALLFPSFS